MIENYSLDIHDLPNEEWRDIKGFEGYYQVSNMGRVKSLRKRSGKELILRQGVTEHGYLAVTLYGVKGLKRLFVHRLVAFAFIPNPNNRPFINHKNEVKTDNRIENLEWCTAKYNLMYGTGMLRRAKTRGASVYKLSLGGVILDEYYSISSAAKINHISDGDIGGVCKGTRITAGGFKWRYVDDNLYKAALNRLQENIRNASKKYKDKKRTQLGKEVKQYTKDGVFIKSYRSAPDASEATGICKASILMNCNGQFKSAGGYVWTH